MKTKFQVSLFSFLFFIAAVNAQTKNENINSFIKSNADSLFKKEKLPGIFIGILNNGERHFYNVGFADPDKQMPFDSATIFEIGSITKTFTAYILMSVLKEKNISDSHLIIQYLPDSVQQNKNLNGITFLSLMNHTSGLPRLPDNINLTSLQPYDNYTVDDLFSYLKKCTPKPDGKSNYSNLGGGLAGVLAQKISGKTYAALLNDYVFLPFKMLSSTTAIEEIKNKSQGYFDTDKKASYWNMNVLTPAGGLKSSSNDLLTYLENMIHPSSQKSKIIIEKLLTPTVALNERISVGRGWHMLIEKDQPIIYWHNGGTYGFSTFCAFLKDKGKAVIVVVNQFNKNAVSDGLGIKIIKKLISEE